MLLLLTNLSAGNKECRGLLEASSANVTKIDNNMQGTLNTSVQLTVVAINPYWLPLLDNPACS